MKTNKFQIGDAVRVVGLGFDATGRVERVANGDCYRVAIDGGGWRWISHVYLALA